MRATGFNHVRIHARNLEESMRFYVEVFGMETIPTYTFAFPVQYLRLGDLQLHLFERDTTRPLPPHRDQRRRLRGGLRPRERARDPRAASRSSRTCTSCPTGACRCTSATRPATSSRLDWPDVTTLDRSRSRELKKLGDSVPQTGDALRGDALSGEGRRREAAAVRVPRAGDGRRGGRAARAAATARTCSRAARASCSS